MTSSLMTSSFTCREFLGTSGASDVTGGPIVTSGGVKERECVPRGGVAVAAEVDAPDDEEFVEEVA